MKKYVLWGSALILLSGCAYGKIRDNDAYFIGVGRLKIGDNEIESKLLPEQMPINLEVENE